MVELEPPDLRVVRRNRSDTQVPTFGPERLPARASDETGTVATPSTITITSTAISADRPERFGSDGVVETSGRAPLGIKSSDHGEVIEGTSRRRHLERGHRSRLSSARVVFGHLHLGSRVVFDPFDPGPAQDDLQLLADMRKDNAVVEIARGMQYVTRHAECRDVLRDAESFSNATGMKAPGVEIPEEDRLLGELDPPRHTRVRRVMVTALAPKVVHAAEPFMQATAESLLDELTGPNADLVPAFTVQLPNRVTLHLLGIDPADAPQLAAWAKGLMESTFPATNRTERGVGFAGAFPEFAGYIDARIAERTTQLANGNTPDDVLARLLQLDDDGEPLPHRQVRALVRNLITGGLTTTSQLLGNLLHELLTDTRHRACASRQRRRTRARDRGEPTALTAHSLHGAWLRARRGDRRLSHLFGNARDRGLRVGEPR